MIKNIGIWILDIVKSNENLEHIILFDTMKKDIKDVPDELTKIMLEMKDEKSARVLSETIDENWKEIVKSYVITTKKILFS